MTNGVTSCPHRCGRCKRPWIHDLIDQSCLIAAKALCQKCHAQLAEREGQGGLFPGVKLAGDPEQLDLL